MTFPCPHTRELSDRELDNIAAHGIKDWNREQQAKKKRENEPLDGDEWKGAQ